MSIETEPEERTSDVRRTVIQRKRFRWEGRTELYRIDTFNAIEFILIVCIFIISNVGTCTKCKTYLATIYDVQVNVVQRKRQG